MTYTKSSSFDISQQELAQYAKLLSHPARVAIIELLIKKKACISGDIANELPLSRTTVSQHLQELKKAGLISGEVEGLKINYCLNLKLLLAIKEKFDTFFGSAMQAYSCDC